MKFGSQAGWRVFLMSVKIVSLNITLECWGEAVLLSLEILEASRSSFMELSLTCRPPQCDAIQSGWLDFPVLGTSLREPKSVECVELSKIRPRTRSCRQ